MDPTARFVRHVRERRLLPPGARVLVACSGGADSTALAVLVTEQSGALALGAVTLAHLDHGLRARSADDLLAVERLAAALGVPFVGAREPVTPGPGESPEEAARRVRYAFLARAAAECGATHVATAHHLDDQAETVLLRALRGTGPLGLAGIAERRPGDGGVEIVRPLLPFRHAALSGWLEERGIAWCEDPTNHDGNERARVRRIALPALAECVGRDPVPLLARLAANAADGVSPPDRAVAAGFVDVDGAKLRLHAGFERLPAAMRAATLRDQVPDLRDGRPLTRAEVERLLVLVAGGDAGQVAGVDVDRDGPVVSIRPARPPRTPPAPVAVRFPGATELWDGWRLSIEVVPAGNEPFVERLGVRDGRLEIIDADRVVGPLHVRVRRDGDRLRPLGAAEEARLAHVLQRRGVAAARRDRLPLLVDGDGVAWAAGVCVADRLRVTASTRRIAVLRISS